MEIYVHLDRLYRICLSLKHDRDDTTLCLIYFFRGTLLYSFHQELSKYNCTHTTDIARTKDVNQPQDMITVLVWKIDSFNIHLYILLRACVCNDYKGKKNVSDIRMKIIVNRNTKQLF